MKSATNTRATTKRILNVTAEQFDAVKQNGTVECGTFSWMPQHVITHVAHPDHVRVLPVTSSYHGDKVRLVLVVA